MPTDDDRRLDAIERRLQTVEERLMEVSQRSQTHEAVCAERQKTIFNMLAAIQMDIAEQGKRIDGFVSTAAERIESVRVSTGKWRDDLSAKLWTAMIGSVGALIVAVAVLVFDRIKH